MALPSACPSLSLQNPKSTTAASSSTVKVARWMTRRQPPFNSFPSRPTAPTSVRSWDWSTSAESSFRTSLQPPHHCAVCWRPAMIFFGRKITPERSMPPRTLSLPRLLCHSFKLDKPSGLRRTLPYWKVSDSSSGSSKVTAGKLSNAAAGIFPTRKPVTR